MMQFIRVWYLTQIATLALLFKRRDIALAYYNKILVAQPEHALTMSRVAFLHHDAGDRVRAIVDFERVVAVNPNDANSWFNLGYLRQDAHDHASAIDAFEQAVTINENHDRAWYGKALSLIASGQHADAIAPLKKKCRAAADEPVWAYAIGAYLFQTGRRCSL